MDYIGSLTEAEIQRLLEFKHVNRKMEFVATRVLRHQLFGFDHIHYDPNGAPYIDSEGYISVSHTRGMVGIAVNKNYKLGLDLERYRPNILLLKDKFLSEAEKLSFDIEDSNIVTQIWSAKEALYKLSGRKKIIFARELLVERIQNNNWEGTIINPNETLKVKMNIFEKDDTVITINASEIEKI
jgi:phosphopantetheinyl transferase